ncbi:hypothetical protein D3C71_776440 [compost metagenome]
MFKRLFFLGITAGLFSSLISWVYSYMYTQIADFTEHSGYFHLLSFSMMITVGISILGAIVYRLIKNQSLASFIIHLILSGISISLVFYVFKMDDPVFKNEDAMAMIDYFKGYLIPFTFIPALSWLTFKPLFIK